MARGSQPPEIGRFIPNDSQTPEADQLHGGTEANGQQVCLQLGSIEETEANHTVYYTPDSPVQRFCCICVSFFKIPRDESEAVYPTKTDCRI